jgi:hypothetical protein
VFGLDRRVHFAALDVDATGTCVERVLAQQPKRSLT